MKSTFFGVFAAAAVLLVSCGETTVSETSSKPIMSREKIDAKLTEIIGVGLPEGATEPSGDPFGAAFPSYSFGFFCEQEELDAFIAASPRLSQAMKRRDEDAPGGPGAPYLLTSWNPEGSDDTLVLKIDLTSLGEKKLHVSLRAVLLEGLKLAP